MIFDRYFTPKEAATLFPLIKGVVKDILVKGKQLQQFPAALQGEKPPAEVQRLVDEIDRHIAELESLGCFFKDWNFEVGLVDFPAIIDGEEVFLCWRSDEVDIGWYHSIEEGYAGRKPLPMEWLIT